MVVGAVGGLVFVGAKQLREWLQIDDVVDAIAVHGACGLWGVLAVGFFHQDAGLCFGYGGALLLHQAAGAAYLILLSGTLSLFFFGMLRLRGLLRVSPEVEAAGLDSKLGVEAYQIQDNRQECHWIAEVLRRQSITPQDVLDALEDMEQIIFKPFTPQAADNKLRGEMEDIIRLFDFSDPEGGQAARIKHATSGISSTDIEASRSQQFTASRSQQLTASRSQQLTPQATFLAFLSHHKRDGGEVARIFADTLRRTLPDGTEDGDHAEALKKFSAQRWVWFDSNNLDRLDSLTDYVCGSQNLVVLMTRSILKRPWVLAEIITARASRRNIIGVVVEWPDKQADNRSFRVPQDLTAAISQWREYANRLPGGVDSIPSSISIHSRLIRQLSKRRREAAGPERQNGTSEEELPPVVLV
jgi:hypothetical protein